MSIIDDIKNTAGDLGDKVGDFGGMLKDKITDSVAGMIDFNDIDVSKFTKIADKFGLMDKLPEDIKTKLDDGTLSDEDLKTYLKDHSVDVEKFVGEHKDDLKNLI